MKVAVLPFNDPDGKAHKIRADAAIGNPGGGGWHHAQTGKVRSERPILSNLRYQTITSTATYVPYHQDAVHRWIAIARDAQETPTEDTAKSLGLPEEFTNEMLSSILIGDAGIGVNARKLIRLLLPAEAGDWREVERAIVKYNNHLKDTLLGCGIPLVEVSRDALYETARALQRKIRNQILPIEEKTKLLMELEDRECETRYGYRAKARRSLLATLRRNMPLTPKQQSYLEELVGTAEAQRAQEQQRITLASKIAPHFNGTATIVARSPLLAEMDSALLVGRMKDLQDALGVDNARMLLEKAPATYSIPLETALQRGKFLLSERGIATPSTAQLTEVLNALSHTPNLLHISQETFELRVRAIGHVGRFWKGGGKFTHAPPAVRPSYLLYSDERILAAYWWSLLECIYRSVEIKQDKIYIGKPSERYGLDECGDRNPFTMEMTHCVHATQKVVQTLFRGSADAILHACGVEALGTRTVSATALLQSAVDAAKPLGDYTKAELVTLLKQMLTNSAVLTWGAKERRVAHLSTLLLPQFLKVFPTQADHRKDYLLPFTGQLDTLAITTNEVIAHLHGRETIVAWGHEELERRKRGRGQAEAIRQIMMTQKVDLSSRSAAKEFFLINAAANLTNRDLRNLCNIENPIRSAYGRTFRRVRARQQEEFQND